MKIGLKERMGNELIGEQDWSSPMIAAFVNTPIVWQITIEDKLAGLIGLVPPTLMSNRAYIWFYHTEILEEHKFMLVRWSQRIIERLLESYPILCGHCVVDESKASSKSMRWLKWLGAEFGDSDGKKIPFQIRKKHG